MKKLLLTVLAIGFIASIALFTKLISQIVEPQISRNVWFSFEPGEEFELQGSKFFVDAKKQLKYYENISFFLKETETSTNSLGMRVSWDRRGYHFADLVPKNSYSYKGTLVEAGLWVWGGNYLHDIGLIFTREDGYAYNIPLGNLSYYGWKRKETFLPLVISSHSSQAGSTDKFEFSHFRLSTHPTERVNRIYVFLDNFVVDESVSFQSYDGSDIEEIIIEENKDTLAVPSESMETTN